MSVSTLPRLIFVRQTNQTDAERKFQNTISAGSPLVPVAVGSGGRSPEDTPEAKTKTKRKWKKTGDKEVVPSNTNVSFYYHCIILCC